MELTPKQLEKLYAVDNEIHTLLENFAGKPIEWDMEIIGEIADVIAVYFEQKLGIPQMDFRPYIKEDEMADKAECPQCHEYDTETQIADHGVCHECMLNNLDIYEENDDD